MGASTIEDYIDRLRRNLSALGKYPHLKIGFEWSGYELETLAQAAPDVFGAMCDLAKAKRTAFYNGTYTQPHLQTLSSEANYRQFEYGMKVYPELCGQPVLTYAHQEASVHDQLPQLLEAFGIKYAVVPSFCTSLAWTDQGELVLIHGQGLHFVQGHEIVSWVGLDGSEIPLYLHNLGAHGKLSDLRATELMKGLLHSPPIFIENPDLIEVDDAWIMEHAGSDFVLLDEAIAERLTRYPSRSHAHFYTHWSYIEGIRAEELLRRNRDAEASALRAEALGAIAFALIHRAAESVEPVWKEILATQHHDAYCFCTPELKGKCIDRLEEARREADRIAERAAKAVLPSIDVPQTSGTFFIAFNPVPYRSPTVITFPFDGENPSVEDCGGHRLPADSFIDGSGRKRARFVTHLRGLGYSLFRVREGSDQTVVAVARSPLVFENAFYRAEVNTDGTIASLTLIPSGEQLLGGTSIPANSLVATDSTGLSPRRTAMAPRENWQPPKRGPELQWVTERPPQVKHSPLGLTLETCGRIGNSIHVELIETLYRELPRIDLQWTFHSMTLPSAPSMMMKQNSGYCGRFRSGGPSTTT